MHEQEAVGGEQLPVYWHNIAGGGCSTGEEGAREKWASVPGTVGAYACRTPRCHRGSAPLRGSCSQASGPLQRARPLAARVVGSLSEYGGQQRVRGGGVGETQSLNGLVAAIHYSIGWRDATGEEPPRCRTTPLRGKPRGDR